MGFEIKQQFHCKDFNRIPRCSAFVSNCSPASSKFSVAARGRESTSKGRHRAAFWLLTEVCSSSQGQTAKICGLSIKQSSMFSAESQSKETGGRNWSQEWNDDNVLLYRAKEQHCCDNPTCIAPRYFSSANVHFDFLWVSIVE